MTSVLNLSVRVTCLTRPRELGFVTLGVWLKEGEGVLQRS